jgi:hypothetical protein
MYDDWTLEELQAECFRRGMPVDGEEEDLIARLENNDNDDSYRAEEAPPSAEELPPLGVDGLNYVSPDNPPTKAIVREG